MDTDLKIDALDRPLYGARQFAAILNRTPRQVYGDLEAGHLDGFVKKRGRVYASTARRLLASLEPAPAVTDGKTSA